MAEAAELRPVFTVEVELDGDDYPVTVTWNIRTRLLALLEQMKDDGEIRGYTLLPPKPD